MHTMCSRRIAVLGLSLILGGVAAFAPQPIRTTPTRMVRHESANSNSNRDENSTKSRQKQQEMKMEALSRTGADKIASLEIAERTKRAMLAEAVEDRIFDLTDQLDALIVNNMIPTENVEKAVKLAKETKVLQIQYEELVSGKASSVLDSMEAATKTSEEDE